MVKITRLRRKALLAAALATLFGCDPAVKPNEWNTPRATEVYEMMDEKYDSIETAHPSTINQMKQCAQTGKEILHNEEQFHINNQNLEYEARLPILLNLLINDITIWNDYVSGETSLTQSQEFEYLRRIQNNANNIIKILDCVEFSAPVGKHLFEIFERNAIGRLQTNNLPSSIRSIVRQNANLIQTIQNYL